MSKPTGKVESLRVKDLPKRALNGMLYQPVKCRGCGYHIVDEAVLIGQLRKQCPNCKLLNEPAVNRIGDEQDAAYQIAPTAAHLGSLIEQVLDDNYDMTDEVRHGLRALLTATRVFGELGRLVTKTGE